MQTDRNRYDQEQRERHPPQWIGEQLAAGFTREHGVPNGIGGEHPEVDERVAKEPEQCPRQQGINARFESQRPRNQLKEHLAGDPNRREEPQ